MNCLTVYFVMSGKEGNSSHAQVNGYTFMFSVIFIKGSNFCDFLFAFQKDDVLKKKF